MIALRQAYVKIMTDHDWASGSGYLMIAVTPARKHQNMAFQPRDNPSSITSWCGRQALDEGLRPG
jgi:hypothetical protein